MKITDLFKEVWEKHEGYVIFSTVNAEGMPNSVYVGALKLLADGRLAIMDNYFHKTRENILGGSRGSVLFIDKNRKSYQAKGSIEYVKSGPVFEEFRASLPEKYPRLAAALFTAEELYSGAERLA